jgi:Rps23 Pro-64 3,4-dihydroxylase Tpa1-like proline 4-hydroxylase
MDRIEIARYIIEKLDFKKEQLKQAYKNTKNKIGFFYVDDLLPLDLAKEIFEVFPNKEEAVLRKSLKEFKYIAFQMDKYHALLEEVIYAFQEQTVVDKVAEICGMQQVTPDHHIYAGGLSIMTENNFLKPHLDNSHDKEREKWRVLNLLFYVTPEWKKEYGGNLEIWPDGLGQDSIELFSKFNRLIVMVTHQESWHSVNKVIVNKQRCCVSNYYYSETPNSKEDRFHVTSFRGRPSEKLLDFVLNFDNKLRMSIRKIFKKGVKENAHHYKNKEL